MAVEIAFLHVQQAGRGFVIALVVGDEKVFLRTQPDPVGLPKTSGERLQRPVRIDPDGPAAPRYLRAVTGHVEHTFEAPGAAEGEGRIELPLGLIRGAARFERERAVEPTRPVAFQTVEEFMVVRGDAPLSADGLERLGPAVAVVVICSQQLGPVRDEQSGFGFGDEPQRFIEAAGEEPPVTLTVAYPDLADARCDDEGARRREGDRGDAGRDFRRVGNVFDFVPCLRRRRDPRDEGGQQERKAGVGAA